MSYVMGDVVELKDFYAENGQNSGYINGIKNYDIPSNTLIATESLTIVNEFILESIDPSKPANITFDSPKITFDFRNSTSSFPFIDISNNGYNKVIFYNASVNFDYAAYDTDTGYIGPMEFSGTSAINITPNSNGKTLIKASTLTGTVSLDVEDGVQNGDTFLIEATDNQLVINSGEWEATPSTSGNITTYTLARVQPALPVPLKKKLRKKLALMLANLKKKRPYYCEVEYLESTGTQYIDTGIYGTENTSFKANLSPNQTTDYSTILGSRTSSDVNRLDLIFRPTGLGGWFGYGTRSGAAVEFSYSSRSRKVFLSDKGKCYIDGSLVGSKIQKAFRTPTTLKLFCNETNGTRSQFFYGKLYDIKIWDNGVLVRDMIPVLDWNMTPCMYDKVSGQLFYNAGTGDFVAGREIHYVDYLENITTQASLNYIPTTYTPTTNTNLEAKVRYTGGASGATWAIGAATWWGIHYQGQGPKIGITNSATEANQVYTPYTAGNDITLKLDGSNVYADGTLVGSLTKTNATSTLSIFRYSTSANLSWVGRIYYLDIWDNNGYVYKFRPAIDSNGTAFLFDQVSHTIYDNAGTGNFAYQPVEIEYLESTGTQYIDTGYSFNSNTDEIELYYQNTSTLANKWLFGSYEDNANIGISSANLSRVTFWYKGNVWGAVSSQYDKEHILRYDSTGMSNDGVNLKAFTSYVGTWNLYLFALNNTGTSPNGYYGYGNVWRYTHTRNGSTLLDLIPAFKDGVAGMLDKVNNVFYQNAGSGSFSVGKIVESEFE